MEGAAGNNFSTDTLEAFQASIRNSMLISADQAHGCHPNYPEKHQAAHRPKFHEGIVIKTNANQRYATDSINSAILRDIAVIAKSPIQEFIVKNDSPCGSTIGPILAGNTGIKTIDIGASQLSMHSVREFCGVGDIYFYRALYKQFFLSFDDIKANLLSS